MNKQEEFIKITKYKYINEKKYMINFEKKENYILISLKDNNYSYISKLSLEDIILNNKFESPINLNELLESLITIKFSELKKINDMFTYNFKTEIKGIKINLDIELKQENNLIAFNKYETSQNHADTNKNLYNYNNLNIKKENEFNIIMENKIINNNIIENGDNIKKNKNIFLNKKRKNVNEFSIFNIDINDDDDDVEEEEEEKIINNDQNKYINVDIQGYEIKFPYQPYKEQIDYMNKIFLCLNSDDNIKKNAILESPHGTGKTLSLLCSILTWNKHLKQKEITPKKIIYCTKNMPKINNLIDELSKIKNWYDINYCILCPRDKICSKQNSKNILNLTKKVDELNEKNDYDYKIYHKRYYKDKYEIKLEKEENTFKACKDCVYSKNVNNISGDFLDIEDLKIEGRNNFFCPFYYMRNKLDNSNIIILPLYYIFDNYFREQSKIEPLIKNSIIIMDEAHYLLKISEEFNNISLEYQDVIKAIHFFLHNEINILISKKENNNLKEMKESILEYLSFLKTTLFELYEMNLKEINKKILDNIFSISAFDNIINDIEFFIFFLEKNNYTNINIKKIKAFLSILNSITQMDNQDYNIYLSFVNDYDNKLLEEINFKININCLNTGKQFNKILSKKPYRIILTGACLSPLHLFESHLNHSFHFKYQGNHIIGNDQLIVKLITHYKLTKDISKTNPFFFIRNISNLEIQYKIIGNILYDLSRITPDGIIMFFSSMTVIKSCIDIWKEEGIYNKIDTNKKIIIDNKPLKLKQNILEDNNNINYTNINDMENYNPLNLYKKFIDEGKGGIIISIFKGKMSKEITFKGKYGRMVINIGIPFINNKTNEKIKLKEKYYYLIGKNIQEWKEGDAMFKINQSCGSIIRDKSDYGVILNIDFRNLKLKSYLSRWLLNAKPKTEEYICEENDNCNINNNKFIQEIKAFYINNKNTKVL